MITPSFKRLIIVSNRLPVSITARKGTVTVNPSAGGLVSSLGAYIDLLLRSNQKTEVLWIGSSDMARDRFTDFYKADHMLHEQRTLYPVFLPQETKDRFYNGFCNDTIWPLFHYFPTYAKFREDDYRHYSEANRIFAEKIMEVYQPGDLVWVHDYHLMLLPALLRQYVPRMPIGFFLHIPFPSFELYRLLPTRWRTEILNGLLGADLIGFHTNDYVQHFLWSVRKLLGHDHDMRLIMTPDRSIMTDVFPVSIDFGRFNHAVSDQRTFAARNGIKKNLRGLRSIVSVDRLDYTKAIVGRLESFDLFLEHYPAYRGRVSYLLVVVPSRDIITRYRENKREIEETVSRINGRYGSIGYTPVVYQYRSLDFHALTGLYLAADVALITPARDGMNLVAKEFIATWHDGKGVLILSETAGAAAELGEALLVNPTDLHETAEALHTALSMPLSEQVQRNEIMRKRIGNYDVTRWAGDFIASLQRSRALQEQLAVREISADNELEIGERFEQAASRLLLLDYDGTLSPFARLPHHASPGPELLRLLERLGSAPQNTVVIISGRPGETLDQWFGHLPLSLVAEHGAFVKMKNAGWEKYVQAEPEWKKHVAPILDSFSDRCPGAFTEQKTAGLSWHYRNADPDLAFLRSRELVDTLNALSSRQDFQVLEGNKVVEVRCPGIDKGSSATRWLQAYHHDFIMAIGDDKTDEDMFRVLPAGAVTIRVGLVPGAARYNFRSQKNVLPFLEKLGDRCGVSGNKNMILKN